MGGVGFGAGAEDGVGSGVGAADGVGVGAAGAGAGDLVGEPSACRTPNKNAAYSKESVNRNSKSIESVNH